MSELEAIRAMRNFINRQRQKLSTMESAVLWQHGYIEALKNMTKVLDALTTGKGRE